MLNNIIMSIIITININMLMMSNPLMIIISIILQTLILTMMLNIMSYSFWFTYMMILILLGGMLVLFIYITTLASNELMKISYMNLIIPFPLFLMINYLQYNLNIAPMKSDSITLMYSMTTTESPKNLMQMYNFPNEMMMMMSIIYLLITLIIVVYITQNQKGPLRQTIK